MALPDRRAAADGGLPDVEWLTETGQPLDEQRLERSGPAPADHGAGRRRTTAAFAVVINGDRRGVYFALPARADFAGSRLPGTGRRADKATAVPVARSFRGRTCAVQFRWRRARMTSDAVRTGGAAASSTRSIRAPSGYDRGRQRRPEGITAAPRSHRLARRRRHLAVAILQVADGRHGLRRVGLLRRRSDVRHDRGFRRAGRRGAPSRA